MQTKCQYFGGIYNISPDSRTHSRQKALKNYGKFHQSDSQHPLIYNRTNIITYSPIQVPYAHLTSVGHNSFTMIQVVCLISWVQFDIGGVNIGACICLPTFGSK